ncbi:glycoside hydrolase family 28 protein [Longimicrobium sp.]|uniref:glycoside hydrolase family 28 protein n=1 Tax=Longimicrobium sp. TaxID=2029185 RepID=UPI002E329824|nr:glycoside hydrolase family 28 protein [Longimicrobium sp.]HEX6036903.1 glycoside hydrolase family 28 protein [Longimicrobium sp.]
MSDPDVPMTSPLSRRDFVRSLGVGAGAALVLPLGTACSSFASAASAPSAANGASASASGATGWDMVPRILARIVPPTFPDRDFPITDHGAVGDGRTDNTAAFRAAVRACAAAGGGRVVVPTGRFLTGPIHLRGNVNLHVQRGATIAFSQDPADYLPAVFTRWEGMEMMGYSPLIYAWEQENVAVTGEGTLDGQADDTHWWPWKGGRNAPLPNQIEARNRLFEMVEAGVPVEQRQFGEGSYLRPQFIQPYRCRNVLIEGVTIVNSPMWEIHPVLCSNVTVRGVRIDTHGPNNDGCDPESCRDVLIENCLFDTGDDCIAIKSGRNADGRRINVPSENIIVRGCRMKEGHGGVTIGSEISGHVRNVFVEDCEMDSPVLDRALRFKNNALRGGILENVYMRNVRVGQVADAVLSVDLYYEEGQQGPFVPVVRNVEMRNVTSHKSKYGLYMRAYERSEISDVRIIDSRFDGVERGNVTEGVRGLVMDGVRINGQLASATSHEAGAKSDADLLPSDVRTTPR